MDFRSVRDRALRQIQEETIKSEGEAQIAKIQFMLGENSRKSRLQGIHSDVRNTMREALGKAQQLNEQQGQQGPGQDDFRPAQVQPMPMLRSGGRGDVSGADMLAKNVFGGGGASVQFKGDAAAVPGVAEGKAGPGQIATTQISQGTRQRFPGIRGLSILEGVGLIPPVQTRREMTTIRRDEELGNGLADLLSGAMQHRARTGDPSQFNSAMQTVQQAVGGNPNMMASIVGRSKASAQQSVMREAMERPANIRKFAASFAGQLPAPVVAKAYDARRRGDFEEMTRILEPHGENAQSIDAAMKRADIERVQSATAKNEAELERIQITNKAAQAKYERDINLKTSADWADITPTDRSVAEVFSDVRKSINEKGDPFWRANQGDMLAREVALLKVDSPGRLAKFLGEGSSWTEGGVMTMSMHQLRDISKLALGEVHDAASIKILKDLNLATVRREKRLDASGIPILKNGKEVFDQNLYLAHETTPANPTFGPSHPHAQVALSLASQLNAEAKAPGVQIQARGGRWWAARIKELSETPLAEPPLQGPSDFTPSFQRGQQAARSMKGAARASGEALSGLAVDTLTAGARAANVGGEMVRGFGSELGLPTGVETGPVQAQFPTDASAPPGRDAAPTPEDFMRLIGQAAARRQQFIEQQQAAGNVSQERNRALLGR